MLKKTCRGYSLVETIISLFLITLLVVAYSIAKASVYAKSTISQITCNLFNDAHTLALLMEDKNFEMIPLILFDDNNLLPFDFQIPSNHTIEMTITDFSTQFDLIVPASIASSRHSIICAYSTLFLDSLEFHQFHLYLIKRHHQTIIYGYASLVL